MLDFRMYRILTSNLSYDEFRSEVYHFIQFNSVKDYIEQLLSYTIIQSLCKKQEYAKGLFLLALFDYYCDEYNADGSEYFSEYRNKILEKRQYPDVVYLQCCLSKSDQPKIDIENLCKNNYYSQFFLKYNIYEYKE